MAHVVLEDGQYTFDASVKTITLSAPYTTLSLGQIISIIDLKTNDVLYDSETQRKDAISISGAVITHTHGNTGMADTDLLQVTIDVGGSAATSLNVAAASTAIILTDSAGDALTEANIQGKNDKLYKIAQTGAGTVYFYIDVDGEVSYKIAGIFVSVDEAMTLSGTLQYYRDGTWVDNSAYDFSFTTVEAQKMNGLYPLEEAHHKFPKRLKCIVSGTCNVYAQAVTL